MAGSTKALTYKIGADLGQLKRDLAGTENFTRKAQKELRELEQRQREHRKALSDLGVGMLSFGAAAAVGLGMAVREAIRWESAFAGVRKTVDGSDEEIAALEGELRNLARTLPATHQEIAAVAEAAGQLGIKRQDIAEFTKTMVDLGETTNLTADEAATALAKFANIMGTSASDVDRLGSALVALGNDGASTEKDIIEMGLRIAGAGRQVGMTESQVLAFASALSSVGIEAEAGGSSFSGVMIKISQAVNDGGDSLDAFSKVAGVSSSKFAAAFQKDAAGAITMFIEGLGKMQASGQDVFGVLDELGLSEIRVRDALLRASGASELFTSSLKTGSTAWAENAALAEEAAKRYDTTEAQIQIAGNQIRDSMIDIGAALLPIVQAGVEGIQNLITWFSNLPGPVKTVVAVVGAAGAAIAVLGGVALIATPKILAFRESMRTMIDAGGKASGALGKFGLFMSGPWAAAIGVGVTLLGLFGVASGAAQQQQQELADAGKSVAQAIAEQNGVINDSVRKDTAKILAEKDLLQIAKDLGVKLPDVTDAVLDQGDAYDSLKGSLEGKLKATRDELAQLESVNSTDSERIKTLAAQEDQYQQLLRGIDDVRGGKDKELQAQEAATEGAKKGTVANKANAESTEDLAKAAEEAAAALDAMVEALDALNGTTLSHREAQRNLVKVMGDADALFAKNAKTLNIHTADGMANAEMLDSVAKGMNGAAEAASREAESTGGAAAGQAALVASLAASRESLFKMARQFFGSAEATWAFVDSVLAIPEAEVEFSTPGSKEAQRELQRVLQAVKDVPPKKEVNVGVLSQSAVKALNDIGYKTRALPDGTFMVSAQTKGAQDRLNELVRKNNNKVLSWTVRVHTQEVGRQSLTGRFTEAYGGVVAFAQGGMHGESHHPQIGRAVPGAVRVWAEEETGNESYIPWAMDRRGRATDILGITADGFGYMLVPKSSAVRSFAHGGVYGSSGTGSPGGLAPIEVRVFVGDTEIRDITRVEIAEQNRATTRSVRAGAGRAR